MSEVSPLVLNPHSVTKLTNPTCKHVIKQVLPKNLANKKRRKFKSVKDRMMAKMGITKKNRAYFLRKRSK